ncbi:MAG TPA: diphthine--ammonia ligase [Gemmatimonadota bacterium]|nr:diphthine--ammonia ligase [Gemmatimonadota bacterium]
MSEGEEGATAAVAWSGGKDSTLALHRARREGWRVTHLLTVYDGESERVAYHGVPPDLIAAQADALGLEAVLQAAEPDHFEEALRRGLGRLREAGVDAVVFGNIHLEDVRAWYEERVRDEGFEHVEPLWGGDPARLAREYVTLGYRAIVVSVWLEKADPAWLGRELEGDLLAEIRARPDVDPCGEKGEFHTFSFDGPVFRRPVRVRERGRRERSGYRYLDLERAEDGAQSERPPDEGTEERDGDGDGSGS